MLWVMPRSLDPFAARIKMGRSKAAQVQGKTHAEEEELRRERLIR